MKHSRKRKSRDNLLGLVLKYEASNFYFMQRMGKYKYIFILEKFKYLWKLFHDLIQIGIFYLLRFLETCHVISFFFCYFIELWILRINDEFLI